MRNIYIAPSLLSADKNKLLEEILEVQRCGATYLHWDVMDGKFVPNTSYKVDDVAKYSKLHHIVNDVHIMVNDPVVEAPLFIDAGADIITFHYEAVSSNEEISDLIDLIHQKGAKAGLAIKPNTNTEVTFDFLNRLDLVLVMSVEPGFGGQQFMDSALDKIKILRKQIDSKGYKTLIEVDGGINDITAKQCIDSGADILVAGSYIFGHNIVERINSLK